jgi:flagellar biosynthesis/type III secretory pathway chaperone
MDDLIGRIEAVLDQQSAAHRAMLTLIDREQQALREAKAGDLRDCCRLENQQIQRIATLEKQRQTLVAELTLLVQPDAAAPMPLREVAAYLPAHLAAGLLHRREELRSLIEQVQRAGGIARRATESLLRHMQGVMQTIGAAMTGVGTYSRKGAAPHSALAVRTLKLTA